MLDLQIAKERIKRKFTRTLVRKMLKEAARLYFEQDYSEMGSYVIWFAAHNIPITLDLERMKFIIADKKIKERFIPEEDEALFDELNDLFFKHGIHTDQHNLASKKMLQIISYLEAKKYTVQLDDNVKQYELKGISN